VEEPRRRIASVGAENHAPLLNLIPGAGPRALVPQVWIRVQEQAMAQLISIRNKTNTDPVAAHLPIANTGTLR